MTNTRAFLFTQATLTHQDRFDPFIYTDLFATYSGVTNNIICHFWKMKNEVVLGMQDTRVTDLAKGVKAIEKHGYNVVVRNSGGLAVVSDEGVINFSIILPQSEEKFGFSIDDGYQLMKKIIEDALSDYNITVDAHEVHDSYCPGEFDLSINSKKFAGIAQRRIKKGIAIMIYLSVSGNQSKRGEIVRDFYQESLQQDFGKLNFPPVNPDSMANLSDLLNVPLTTKEIQEKIIISLDNLYDVNVEEQTPLTDYLISTEFKVDYQKQQDRMTRRNEVLKDLEVS